MFREQVGYTLKMVAVLSSETSQSTYHVSPCHNAEDYNMNMQYRENLEPSIIPSHWTSVLYEIETALFNKPRLICRGVIRIIIGAAWSVLRVE
jgi:hypothetical protein